jgi:hypothetical protein
MRFDELSRRTSVSKSALAAKAKLIMNLLRVMPLEADYCRQEILGRNSLAWMVTVNGIVVDARTLPVEVQVELAQRGLISGAGGCDPRITQRRAKRPSHAYG